MEFKGKQTISELSMMVLLTLFFLSQISLHHMDWDAVPVRWIHLPSRCPELKTFLKVKTVFAIIIDDPCRSSRSPPDLLMTTLSFTVRSIWLRR